MPLEQFIHFVKMFTEDANRVKGIIRLKEGVFLCDCVGAMVRVEPWKGKSGRANVLNALATTGMPLRKGLQSAVRWYPEFVRIVSENKEE